MGLNKMRTFLMMLGIIIGITTLTVIVSVGKGASAKVMKTVKTSSYASRCSRELEEKQRHLPDEEVLIL